jgi:hypothetical protein
MVSNLSVGSGVVVIESSQAHLTHVSTLSSSSVSPHPASSPGRIGGGRRWCPGSCRLSATGICLLGHPAPAEQLSLPHGRPSTAKIATDPNGVTTFHTCEIRPGWVPSIPRGQWCPCGRRRIRQPPPAASLRPVPSPGVTTHQPGASVTRHHQGFTVVHPSGLPLPVAAGWISSP